jgi:hypothetical protein
MDNRTTPVLWAAVMLAVLAGAPAFSRELAGGQPNESQLDLHGHYINRTGQTVHQPAHSLTGDIPTGATAECRDGEYSFSRHSSGTCSGHGGVANWLR